MVKNLRIEGAYDSRTVRALRGMGINDFSFDFRPTSFNFLQHEIFLEIIDHHYSESGNFFLHFENEKNFVIDKFLNDLGEEKVFRKENKNIFLEFSGVEEISYMDDFGVPYFVHYDPDVPLDEQLRGKNLEGLVMDFEVINIAFRKGKVQELANSFYKWFMRKGNPEILMIYLKLDWGANLFPSLFELFDFGGITLPVNDKIEVSYRNVDISKAKEELKYIFYSEPGQ